jgi:hypothetical protein
VLRALPKPSKNDDADLARAAQEAWKALKTDVSAIAGGQIQRLEQAMIARRRWDLATFRALLVAHPLLVHLVRRLLFSAAKEGETATLFRVAEDRTFADAADAPLDLDPAARVIIPHPLEIDREARSAWGSIFADYEIVQPFPQLGREVFTPTDAERAGSELSRFLGARVETGKLFGLEHRGFRRAPGYGAIGVYQRALPGGLTAAFAVSPGVDLTNPAATPEQTLGSLVLKRNQGALAPLGELDPILFSEIVRDLALLVG